MKPHAPGVLERAGVGPPCEELQRVGGPARTILSGGRGGLPLGARRAKRERGMAVRLRVVWVKSVQGSFWDLKVNSGEPWWRATGATRPRGGAGRCVKGPSAVWRTLESCGERKPSPRAAPGPNEKGLNARIWELSLSFQGREGYARL